MRGQVVGGIVAGVVDHGDVVFVVTVVVVAGLAGWRSKLEVLPHVGEGLGRVGDVPF